MLSRFVEEGSKIELRALQRGLEEKGAESTAKVYQSRVLQILSEDTLEISMPMEQTRLILLPVDSEYDMIFFEENSLCKDHRPVQKQQRICAGHGTDQQSAEISEKRILSFQLRTGYVCQKSGGRRDPGTGEKFSL